MGLHAVPHQSASLLGTVKQVSGGHCWTTAKSLLSTQLSMAVVTVMFQNRISQLQFALGFEEGTSSQDLYMH